MRFIFCLKVKEGEERKGKNDERTDKWKGQECERNEMM
jgi:hypothetical protein